MICFWLLIGAVLQDVHPPSASPAASDATPYIERVQRQFPFYPGGKIELTLGVRGDVKIQGWQRPEVAIEVERIVYRTAEAEAKALIDRFPLQLRHTQTAAAIRIPGMAVRKGKGPAFPENLETNLRVFLPEQRTDIQVQTVKGDLALERISGWIEATLGEGSIEVRSISGYFSGLTKLGDIDVELSGVRWEGYEFAAVTHRGQALLRLPCRYSAALQLETRDGALAIDYPQQLVNGESVPLVAVAQKRGRSLIATLGDGGSPIKLLTMLGDIRMEAKDPP